MPAIQEKLFQATHERSPGNHLLLNILLQSPAAIALLEGPDHRYEFTNPLFDQLVGHKGTPGYGAIPDLERIGVHSAAAVLDLVYSTCRSFELQELPVIKEISGDGKVVKKYFNLQINAVNEPATRFFRLWIHATDVTELVEARLNFQESEMRQAVAMEAGQIGSFDWNLITKELGYSSRCAGIFGFPVNATLTHEEFINTIHPDDRGTRLRAMQDGMKTGLLDYPMRITRSDGSTRWSQVKGRIFFNEEKQANRIFGAVLDITEEKAVAIDLHRSMAEKSATLQLQQSELRANHSLFEKMFDGLQDYAIVQLDDIGNVVRWNLGAEKIKGYQEHDILGKNFRIFYSPEDRLARIPEKLLSRALAEGQAETEGWRIRADGTRFWALSTVRALHNDQKKVVGFVKIVRDLTERMTAEEKLQAYSKQLEFRNRELEEFAYVASHDLQEPMRKIQTFIQIIGSNGDDPEHTTRYLTKINFAAQRMSTLVKSVLDYSRLANTEELFRQTDLNEVFRSVSDDFELLISEKEASVQSGELPLVRAIPLQMQQLFSNFISNSLKFCTARPEIRISSRVVPVDEMRKVSALCDSGCWEIQFSDNGIGFDQRYAEEIFTMFRRLNSSADFAGSGIGLALCKKILDNHNGFIRAEASPGNGSTFRIYIPAIRS